jgi:hypothetical protein
LRPSKNAVLIVSVSASVEVIVMDLTTLVTACALTVAPKIMHALIWHQSGGEPWTFSVSGQRQPQVLRSMEDAVGAARDQPDNIAIRVGLAGLPSTPRSVTTMMFVPCSNIASAARQIAQFAELCKTSVRAKGDPIHCAVATYHGSWERPDNGFADAVSISVANDDMPDFEMPAGTGTDASTISVGAPPASRDTALPASPEDRERARESPLFPVVAKPPDHLPSDHLPSATPASDQPAATQKTNSVNARLTASQPRTDSLFVPRSAQRSESERNDDIPKF